MARNDEGIAINQWKFVLDILSNTGLLGVRSTKTPSKKGLKLLSNQGPLFDDLERYQSLNGRLLYLCISRLDITYIVQQLSQFVNSPCQAHWDVALHLLRYLKGCQSVGLLYPAQNSFNLVTYCNADWASCTETRKSLTNFCVYMGAALIY